MSDYYPVPTLGQRQFLQRLRSDQWRALAVVKASDRLLTTVIANGWIERRDEGQYREVRLTMSGLEVLRNKL